ncbi:mitochondrial 54S ribosomal protein YmL47 [Starmerella bacillaris]|uniref:Mitochondrial 54S ribosomal protein YmL47 n=1 Tax=Starmerella bacillaris TaxID=1247836 RepID=A0AAV5RPL1_STABA|nr:mitochondrial 54S ribosomal protein YmL47 [Starmerella bacillaris]
MYSSFAAVYKAGANLATQRITGFSKIFARNVHHYEPRKAPPKATQKGRVPVRTGGSIKGSTLVHGKYGLRLKSEGIRLKAIQLQEADNSIMRALRPLEGKLYRRLHTNISVYIKGNETRMGKGKGSFDHWMCRVPTGKIIFEIDGAKVPLAVAKEAFRIAKDKLPGNYEFVTRDTPPKVGFKPALKPEERPVLDYTKILNENPTPKWANWQQQKNMDIRQYLRR